MRNIELDGKNMPRLGFGTWQAKGRGCEEAVASALDIGYRHIDTAQIYENEEAVGKGIQMSDVDRDEFWLTTKLWRDNLNEGELKPSLEQSLQKLRTDYVDLLLIHWPFEQMEMEVVFNQMADLVDEGKVKNIGVSNFNTEQMERASEISDKPILTNQVEYHPFLDQSEVLEKCRELDMVLTAYSPLARADVIGNSTLKSIGEGHGKTEAQVALRWILQQENTATIPKASSRDHRIQNFDIFDFKLSDEEMKTINKLSNGRRKVDPSFSPNWD